MRRPPWTEVSSGCLVCRVSHSPLYVFIIDVSVLNSKLTLSDPSRLPRSRSREVANSPAARDHENNYSFSAASLGARPCPPSISGSGDQPISPDREHWSSRWQPRRLH